MRTPLLTARASKLAQLGPLRSTSALRADSSLVSRVRLKRGGDLHGARSVLWFGPPSLVWLVAIGAAPDGDPGAAASIWGHFPPLRNPFGSPTPRAPITYLTAANPGGGAAQPVALSASAPAVRLDRISGAVPAAAPGLSRVPMTALRGPNSDRGPERASENSPSTGQSSIPSKVVPVGAPAPSVRKASSRAMDQAPQRKIPLRPSSSTASPVSAVRPALHPYSPNTKPAAPPAVQGTGPSPVQSPAAASAVASPPLQRPQEALPAGPTNAAGGGSLRTAPFLLPASSSFRTTLGASGFSTHRRPQSARVGPPKPTRRRLERRRPEPKVSSAPLPTAVPAMWSGLRAPTILLGAPQLRAAPVQARAQAPLIAIAPTTLLRAPTAEQPLQDEPSGAREATGTSLASQQTSSTMRSFGAQSVVRLVPPTDALRVMPGARVARADSPAAAVTEGAAAPPQRAPTRSEPLTGRSSRITPVFANASSTMRFVRRPPTEVEDAGLRDNASPASAATPATTRPSSAVPPTTGTGAPNLRASVVPTVQPASPASARPRTTPAATPARDASRPAAAPSSPARKAPPASAPATARRARRLFVARAPTTSAERRARDLPERSPNLSAPRRTGSAPSSFDLLPPTFPRQGTVTFPLWDAPRRVWLSNSAGSAGSAGATASLRPAPLLVALGAALGPSAPVWVSVPGPSVGAATRQSLPTNATYVARTAGIIAERGSAPAAEARYAAPPAPAPRSSERWSSSAYNVQVAPFIAYDSAGGASAATAGPHGRPVWRHAGSPGRWAAPAAVSNAFGPRSVIFPREAPSGGATQRGQSLSLWAGPVATVSVSRPAAAADSAEIRLEMPQDRISPVLGTQSGSRSVQAPPFVPMTNLRNRPAAGVESEPTQSTRSPAYTRKPIQAKKKPAPVKQPQQAAAPARVPYAQWVAEQTRAVEPSAASTPKPTETAPPPRRAALGNDIRALAEVELLEVLTLLAVRDPAAAAILHDIGRELDDISRLDRLRLL